MERGRAACTPTGMNLKSKLFHSFQMKLMHISRSPTLSSMISHYSSDRGIEFVG